MNWKNLENKKWFPYTVAVCSGVILYMVLSNLGFFLGIFSWVGKYFGTVILGTAIAYIINPLAKFLQRRVLGKTGKEGWGVSCLVALILVLLIIVLLMISVIPQLITSIKAFADNLDMYIATAENMISNMGLDQNEYIQNLVTQVMSGYTQYVITEGKDPENFDENMQEYLATPEAQAIINEQLTALFDDLAAHPIPEDQMDKLTKDLTDGYQSYAEENSLPEPEKLLSSFQKYLQTEDGKERLTKGIESSVNTKKLEKSLSEALGSMFSGIAGSLGEAIASGLTSFMEQFAGKIETVMTSAVEQIATNMNDAFSIHPEEFAKAISMNMDEQELSELLTSLMSKQPASYESNLKLLGYADIRKPYAITIYPRDFEGKGKIIEILDAYNERMRFLDEEKVITYTDTVGLLMSSVTDIINAISYVLIAFVAISLVVSSIMIGVITYISVLERRKEIGILRAIGASKRNVSSVFNAETFIIGLLAGLFGIGITLLLLIPGNMLIHHLTDADIWARLPVTGAVTLVILSVVLTLIGGLLPSRKAAKSDPVAALRSE